MLCMNVVSILDESTGCLCFYGIHFADYLRNYFPSSSSVFKYVMFRTNIFKRGGGGGYCLFV